jgi:hypothetical protein
MMDIRDMLNKLGNVSNEEYTSNEEDVYDNGYRFVSVSNKENITIPKNEEFASDNIYMNYSCYYLLNYESNTFNLDIFKSNLYIEKLKKWFNNINQIINFEDTKLLLTQKEINEIHNKIGYNIPINKKNEVINDIASIKTYLSLETKYINTKLTNPTNPINPDNQVNPTNSVIDRIKQTAELRQNENDVLGFNENDVLGFNENLSQNLSQHFSRKFSKINNMNDNQCENIKYVIVFNKIYQSSFLIENPDNIDNELLNSEKCGFKNYYEFSIEKNNGDFIKMINTLLSYNMHDDENDFKKRIDLITNLYNQYKNDMKTKTEFENIKDFITNSYDINDNINYKIKASDILTIIENYYSETNNTNFIQGDISFRNKLSKYLTDLGLKKKRLSDGIYYFGLVLKDNSKYKYNNNINLLDKDILNKLKNSRCNIDFSISK